eukprot:CAMPEP_0203848312 /NCGR_PEP_ID=MMETSP0359-20131031/5529_1 /ASSEMBLY_ACC=CAM_ASM_000338 /TAXON_ID=268821 /ORGANISM="Scrippsiella Hangoei, Strain SHTV-5" /LENGTH=55 /DNA_ID=CAMNT_0050763895 /DNA_START=143 /DNA_END=310 /DNA_ORIENTATION=-
MQVIIDLLTNPLAMQKLEFDDVPSCGKRYADAGNGAESRLHAVILAADNRCGDPD